MDITLTLDQIKSAVNEAITAMTEFAHEQGLNGLAYDGLPALWQDADGHEFEVKRGPTIETTAHDPIGNPVAHITAYLDEDGSCDLSTIEFYVPVPEEFTI